jgi:acyl-CoA synthetase (AMP-forming)/AMP-acid ligase II
MVFFGLNYYPQLIEQTVEVCHPALRQNCTAAFSIKLDGEDRLIIAQEIERSYRHDLPVNEIVEIIRWSVFEKYMIDVYGIVLLKTGSIPKTSSGKIQRNACKMNFINDSSEVLYQWRCPQNQSMDMTSTFKRYFNPVTNLKRYFIVLQA